MSCPNVINKLQPLVVSLNFCLYKFQCQNIYWNPSMPCSYIMGIGIGRSINASAKKKGENKNEEKAKEKTPTNLPRKRESKERIDFSFELLSNANSFYISYYYYAFLLMFPFPFLCVCFFCCFSQKRRNCLFIWLRLSVVSFILSLVPRGVPGYW